MQQGNGSNMHQAIFAQRHFCSKGQKSKKNIKTVTKIVKKKQEKKSINKKKLPGVSVRSNSIRFKLIKINPYKSVFVQTYCFLQKCPFVDIRPLLI